MNTLIALTLALGLGQGPSVEQYSATNFHDASFTARIKFGSQPELRKINSDFGESYRFEYTDFKLKEPFKLRGQTKVEDTDLLFILNGPNRLIRAPRQRVNVKQNLYMKPGQRQTALDFGIITPGLFNDFLNGKFVRSDRATGDVVFDLTYETKFKDPTRFRVWIDTEKKYVTKREWYGQDGNLKATFLYSSPLDTGGCWVPTRCSVKNNDGKIAGETYYTGLKVNSGIPDSVFAIS